MSAFVAGYLAGAISGVLVVWRFAKAVERFRRARVDFRHYVNGARGQIEVVRNNGWQMLKLGAGTLLVSVAVLYVLVKSV